MADISASDLQRIAELIKLAAQTAKAMTSSTSNGKLSTVTDIIHQIEAAAQQLAEAAQQLDDDTPPSPGAPPVPCDG